MAKFTDIHGQEVTEHGQLDEHGNNIQDGVFSIAKVNEQFADAGSGAQPPEPEPDEDDDRGGIQLDTKQLGKNGQDKPFDPTAEIKVGEETFTAEDVLTHLQEQNKADYSQLSDADKSKLVSEYIASLSKETGEGGEAGEGEDPEITIGGETKKSSEWFAQMETEDEADYSELSEKAKANLLERYVTKLNRAEWEKSGQHRDQANAETRRALQARAKELDQQRRQIDFNKKRIEAQLQKARERATQKVSEDDLYDAEGRPNLVKQREYYKSLDAQDEIPELEQELQRISQEAAQAEADHLLAEITSLQTNHPELQTKEPFTDVVRKVETERQMDHPDFPTLRMIRRVLTEAADSNVDAETAFKFLVNDGVIKSVRATQPPNQPNQPQKNRLRSFAESVSRKQAASTRSLPPGTVLQRAKPKQKVTLGAQINQALRGTSNKALEDAGY